MKKIKTIPKLPRRDRDAHKGDFGHVLVFGGSHGMIGAPCLCGDAALRSGAGLVTVAVPSGIYPIVAAKLTCCMTMVLPQRPGGGIDDSHLDAAIEYAGRFDVIAIGPGMGRAPETSRFARAIVERVSRPMVIDADALFALNPARSAARKGPARIFTPHPGEMARLVGLRSASEVQRDRSGIAARLAKDSGAVVVLKGHQTVVTDGERLYVNTTGNPGMATGGTGDVLTGVIAGLLAQRLGPFESAQLGVYLHGLAGDIAAKELGETSLIASDVLNALPQAFKKCAVRR